MTQQHISKRRYAFYIVVLILSVTLLYWLVARDLRVFLVPSTSMEPTLQPKDYILTVSEPVYNRGDVVVMIDPTDEQKSTYVVKRIVAVEGDRVRIEGGALFLNGHYASEPYIREAMSYDFPLGRPSRGLAEYTVPEGAVFALGDNRNKSEDSSRWKPPAIPISQVVGTVQFIYLPFSRMGEVAPYPLVNMDGG
jgi:signal peptidase I